MSTTAKDTRVRRSSDAMSGQVGSRRSKADEARHLFENQLVHVSLRLPQTETLMAEVEFEMSMRDLMANVFATEISKTQEGFEQPEPEPLQPTPRLRRAIASAEKIKTARFATVEEMFDALAEEARR